MVVLMYFRNQIPASLWIKYLWYVSQVLFCFIVAIMFSSPYFMLLTIFLETRKWWTQIRGKWNRFSFVTSNVSYTKLEKGIILDDGCFFRFYYDNIGKIRDFDCCKNDIDCSLFRVCGEFNGDGSGIVVILECNIRYMGNLAFLE